MTEYTQSNRDIDTKEEETEAKIQELYSDLGTARAPFNEISIKNNNNGVVVDSTFKSNLDKLKETLNKIKDFFINYGSRLDINNVGLDDEDDEDY